MKLFIALLLVFSPLALAQQPATSKETHPPLTWHQCQKGGHCSPVHGAIVLDAGWHWQHDGKIEGIEAANYEKNYGVIAHGDSVRLNFKTGKNIGSRFYLLAANQTKYEMFRLRGQEFTFDIDTSKLPCAMNGALYLASMQADGGMDAKNHAGARYGTGYCDAQCPGGKCCDEMDLWEANNAATALTPHPCSGHPSNSCDKGGCGYNPYSSDKNFYGPGKTIDTNKVFTVVTQFITNDGTPNGQLTEIRRLYVQNGKVIGHSNSATNAITEAYCKNMGDFNGHGGLKKMGEALHDGMVLIWSLWQDTTGDMKWLDTGNNGPCPTQHVDLEAKYPHAYVTFSNIRVGPIGSTYHH